MYCTCSYNQYLGLTAADTVQEGPGSDVEVEERHHTAQLGHSKPYMDEVRFVAHQQGHGIPLFQSRLLQEDLSYPVTPPVHVLVGVNIPFMEDEGLVRLPFSLFHKPVQYRENLPSEPVELHRQPIFDHFQQVSEVMPEVGEEEFLEEMQGDNPSRSARHPRGHHRNSRSKAAAD